MRIDILTIFPEIFEAPLGAGLLGKAIEAGSLEVVVSDIRDFADDSRRPGHGDEVRAALCGS
jgi:tRNA (guanine37-N1)-methyltransferase